MRRWVMAVGVLMALALLLALADLIAWRAATARMRSELDSVLADMRSQGWNVLATDPETGGWPFAATLAISDVHVDGGGSALPGGLSWSTDRIVLAIALADPWHLSVQVQGLETLRVSHVPALAFFGDRIAATIPLGRGRPSQIELSAEGLAGGLQASRRQQDVSVGHLSIKLQAKQTQGTLDANIDFAAGEIGLPDKGRWPLGATVTHLSATMALTSPRVSGADSRAQAQSWRDGGGKLDVHALDLRWGPLTLVGDARLGLDDRLQPEGKGKARVQGYADALDALAAGGVIGPGMAVTYKAILGVMAAGDIASPALRVPFTLRDSTLSLGEIPMARFRDVVWR